MKSLKCTEMSIKKIHTSQEKRGQIHLLFSFQLTQIFITNSLSSITQTPRKRRKKCCSSVLKIPRGQRGENWDLRGCASTVFHAPNAASHHHQRPAQAVHLASRHWLLSPWDTEHELSALCRFFSMLCSLCLREAWDGKFFWLTLRLRVWDFEGGVRGEMKLRKWG
jgi:hypothetical protein